MTRILTDEKLLEKANISHNCVGRESTKHEEPERALFDWICDMRISKKCISEAIIQAKMRQLAEVVNLRLPSNKQTETEFSDGWLGNFKTRWQSKSLRLHGKAGDLNDCAMEQCLRESAIRCASTLSKTSSIAMSPVTSIK